jgi:hypothetical protein
LVGYVFDLHHAVNKLQLSHALGLLGWFVLQLQVQGLPDWQRAALLAAQERNAAVWRDAMGRFYIRLSADKFRYITKSMRGQRLFWGLTGCLPGVQHFKFCAPRAVASAAALQCKMCACVLADMVGTGMGYMHTSEEQLVCMLYWLAISSSMCAQVAVDWWDGRIDFLHAQHNMLIQADGSCHDKGYYSSSRQQVLQRDFEFCAAAYDNWLQPGGSVLRVSTRGCDMHQSLHIGFQLAAAGGVIVLSPSYSAVIFTAEDGQRCSFTTALRAALQDCDYTVQHGWHVFQWQAHAQ